MLAYRVYGLLVFLVFLFIDISEIISKCTGPIFAKCSELVGMYIEVEMIRNIIFGFQLPKGHCHSNQYKWTWSRGLILDLS